MERENLPELRFVNKVILCYIIKGHGDGENRHAEAIMEKTGEDLVDCLPSVPGPYAKAGR